MIFDGADAIVWHQIKDICGSSFLSLIGNDRPVPVLDTAFDYLRERYSSGPDGLMKEPVELSDIGIFNKDDLVVVLKSPVDGFLSGQIGRVIWSDNKGTKAVFKIFGRESEIFVPRSASLLEKYVGQERSPQYYGRRRRDEFSPLQPALNRV